MPLELYSLWHQYPWQLGNITCILRTVMSEATAYASILTIVTFSCEQYYAVCHPLQQTGKSKIKRAFRNIVVIWLISLAGAAPYGLFTKVNYITLDDGAPILESAWCGFPFTDPDRHWETLMLCSTFFFFGVPMTLISVLYFRISLTLYRARNLVREGTASRTEEQPQSEGQRARIRSRMVVIKMLMTVVVAFFVCWAPYHSQRLLFLYVSLYGQWTETLRKVNQDLFSLAGCFYYFNSTINPILYSVMSNRFRVAFRENLCAGNPCTGHLSFCCCCWRRWRDLFHSSNSNNRMKQSDDNIVLQIDENDSKSSKKVFHQSIQSIGSALLYGICSTSMAFTNKAIITSYKFHFPFFIMACQMVLCIIFLEILRVSNVTSIPKYTLKLGRSFAWPAVFYALHSVTALYALGGMSIPMYAAIKRCAPIVTLILSVVLLKKRIPNASIISSVILISVGCIVASLGDLEFDSKAYQYGAISILVQGLYLTLAQKCLEHMSALQVLYLSSYNTTPFYVIVCLLLETQGISQFEYFSDLGFILCFGVQVSIGVLLNYSLFLCTEKNSALTTSLVGVLKSIMQTVIGFFTFGGVKFSVLNIFGISLNMIGGILYSYSKYKEKIKVYTDVNMKPV